MPHTFNLRQLKNGINSFLIPLIVLNLYGVSNAQVAYVTSSTSKVAYAAGGTSNRLLVVTVSDRCVGCTASVNDITYGTTSLTQREDRVRDDIRIEIWTLDEAGIVAEGGNATFTVTWNGGGPTDELFSVATFDNVDQTTPVIQTRRERVTSNTAITFNPEFNPGINDMIFYGVQSDQLTSQNASAEGYTELFDRQGAGQTTSESYKIITSAGTEGPTATMANSGRLVLVGMHVKYAGAGTFTATQDGDWDIGTTWGGGCTSSCTPGVDYPTDLYYVEIPSAIDITVPSGFSAACYDLQLNSSLGTTSATLTLADNTSSLTVGTYLTFNTASNPGVDGVHLIDMNGGDITVGVDLTLKADESASTTVNYIGPSQDATGSYNPADGTGTNRLLVVTVSDENNNNIGTVTDIQYGTTSLTLQESISSGGDAIQEIWTLDEAGIDAEGEPANVTVTWSGGSGSEKINIFTLDNVDQTDPVGSSSSNFTNGVASLQLAEPLNASADDMVIYASLSRGNGNTQVAPLEGYTQVTELNTNGFSMVTNYKAITATGDEQPTVTWTNSSRTHISALLIKAVGGGGDFQESRLIVDGGTLTVEGDLILASDGVNANSEIDLTTVSGSTLVLGGSIVESGAVGSGQLISTDSNSDFTYKSLNNETIETLVGSTAISTIGSLVIEGTDTKTLEGSLIVSGSLTIDGTATLDASTNSANLNVGGNWTNNSTFTQGTQTVTLDGSVVSQTIGGTSSTDFYDLVLNNTSGSVPAITLDLSVLVENSLTMTSGDVDLATFTLTLGTAPGTPGTLSYTNGRLYNGSFTRYINATTFSLGDAEGYYPMGDTDGYWRPFYVAPITAPSSGGTLTVSITTSDDAIDVGPVDDNGTDILRQHVSSWNVSTGGGLAGGDNYSLRAGGTGLGEVDVVSDLRLMISGDVAGTDGGASGSPTSPLVDRTGLTLIELGDSFHIGSIDDVDSPLPVDLVSFSAQYKAGVVEVKWATASELNNDYFILERSRDGIHFDELHKEEGAGTVNIQNDYAYQDIKPFPGISYYRLRQVDFDGTEEIFNPVSVESLLNSEYKIYPNPTKGRLTLYGVAIGDNIEIFTSAGVNVTNLVRSLSSNQNGIQLDISNLDNGVYYIKSGVQVSGVVKH